MSSLHRNFFVEIKRFYGRCISTIRFHIPLRRRLCNGTSSELSNTHRTISMDELIILNMCMWTENRHDDSFLDRSTWYGSTFSPYTGFLVHCGNRENVSQEYTRNVYFWLTVILNDYYNLPYTRILYMHICYREITRYMYFPVTRIHDTLSITETLSPT